MLQRIYNTVTTSGLRTVVTGGTVAKSRVMAFGVIKDAKGKEVGSFERILQRRRNGAWYALHNHLELDPPVQGRGFAFEWNRIMETWYRRNGIREIHLQAGYEVGGYAWARFGYQWLTKKDAQLVASTVYDALDSNFYTRRQREATVEVVRQFYGKRRLADLPSPYELSEAGHIPTRRNWPGRDGMLGSTWLGVKPLGGSKCRSF